MYTYLLAHTVILRKHEDLRMGVVKPKPLCHPGEGLYLLILSLLHIFLGSDTISRISVEQGDRRDVRALTVQYVQINVG